MRGDPYLKCHGNGYWYLHWTEDGRGDRVSTKTKDKAAANAFLARWILDEQREGKIAKEESPALALNDLWPIYREKKLEKTGASLSAADYAWQNLSRYFGPLLPAQIDGDRVDAYVTLRGSGKIGRASKPQTCRKELAYLVACMNFCAEPTQKGLVKASDIQKITLPDAGDPRDRWLRANEIDLLFKAAAAKRGADGRLTRTERFLRLALETAGRKQALLDLTWDRVDLEVNVIHLDVPGRKKTTKGRASVPISRKLREMLDVAATQRLRRNNGTLEPLVLDNKGEVWALVQNVAIAAGLGGDQLKPGQGKKPKRTGVSPHVLRHTAATNMARAGVPLWKIAKILGNSLLMVEKVYAKHAPDDLRDAVNLISAERAAPAKAVETFASGLPNSQIDRVEETVAASKQSVFE
jgi:integrase